MEQETENSEKPDYLTVNHGLDAHEYEHVIVLIHGIRDVGAWQHNVSRELVKRKVKVVQKRYKLFGGLEFLFPLRFFRESRVKAVAKGLEDVQRTYKNAKMSVIAHSFGSWLTLAALESHTLIEVHKLIFCGSVVDDVKNWDAIENRIGEKGKPTSDFILNECGTGDYWPVWGNAFGFGYGIAGTTGFSEEHVTNRFHKGPNGEAGSHNLYFDNEFVRKNWRPYLIDNEPPKAGDGKQGEHLGKLTQWLYFPNVQLATKTISLVCWIMLLVLSVYSVFWLSNRTKDYLYPPLDIGAVFTDLERKLTDVGPDEAVRYHEQVRSTYLRNLENQKERLSNREIRRRLFLEWKFAWLLLTKDQFQHCVELCERLLTLDPEWAAIRQYHIHALLELGGEQLYVGNANRALSSIEEATNSIVALRINNPGDETSSRFQEDANRMLGKIFTAQGRFNEAIRFLEVSHEFLIDPVKYARFKKGAIQGDLTKYENLETFSFLAAIKFAIGQLDEARVYVNKGISICKELQKRKQENQDVSSELAYFHLLSGMIDRYDRRFGVAERSFRKSMELCDNAGEQPDAPISTRAVLASAYSCLGELQLESGFTEETVSYLKKGHKLLDEIIKSDIGDHSLELHLGYSLLWLGRGYEYESDFANAITQYREAVSVAKKFGSVFDNKISDYLLSVSFQLLGNCFKRIQQSEKALSNLNAAYEISKKYANSDFFIKIVHSENCRALFDFHHSRFHVEESSRFAREALECSERLVERFPDQASIKNEYLLSISRVAHFESVDRGDFQEALKWFEKARDLRNVDCQENPSNSRSCFEHASAIALVGEANFQLNNYLSAVRAFEKSISLIEQLGLDFDTGGRLVTIYRLLGDAHLQSGKLRLAMKNLQKAVEVSDGISSKFSRRFDFKVEEAILRNRLSKCHFELGDLKRSTLELARVKDLLARLKGEPSSNVCQRRKREEELWFLTQQNGRIQEMRGNFDDAIACYLEAIQIATTIVERYPQNLSHLIRLGESHFHIGNAYLVGGSLAEASSHFKLSRKTYAELIRNNQHSSVAHQYIKSLEARMDAVELRNSAFGRWEDLLVHPPDVLAELLVFRSRFYFKRQSLREVRKVADKLVEIAQAQPRGRNHNEKGGILYNAACSYCRCIVIAESNGNDDLDIEKLMNKAMNCIKLAFDAGYDDVKHLLRDPDLEPLLNSAKFREWLGSSGKEVSFRLEPNLNTSREIPLGICYLLAG